MTAATYVEWLKSAALSNDAVRHKAMKEESGNRGFTNPAADELIKICEATGYDATADIARITGVSASIIARAKDQAINKDYIGKQPGKAPQSKQAKIRAAQRSANMKKVVKIIARLTKNGDPVRTKHVSDEAGLAWGTVRNHCRTLWEEGRIVAEYDGRKHMTITGVKK